MTLINNGLLQPAWNRGNSTLWRHKGLITGPAIGGIPVIPSYLGQVATRTINPTFLNTTNKQLRCRRVHFARSAITSLQLSFPNFYVDGFQAGATYTEKGSGAASTVFASIEYPIGVTFTQVKFSGATSGTIPNGSCLLSDAVSVPIPSGALFGVRVYYTNTAGIVFSLGDNSLGATNVPGNFALGDVLDAAVSGLSNNTLGGAYTNTSGTNAYSAMVIVGMTTAPSILVGGDSIDYGVHDAGDSSGDLGSVCRSIGPTLAYSSFGNEGDSVQDALANSTQRLSFLPYFSHFILQMGVNDFIVHNETGAQLITNTASYGALLTGVKAYLCTILPAPTTTDDYATLINQTVPSYETNRVTANTSRRTAPSPYVGCFDLASVFESSFNSGKIIAGSGYLNTLSSVHPTPVGYLALKNSGVIPPSAF